MRPFIVAALICCVAAPARADEADEALAHLERGLALHLRGDDAAAIVELEQARAVAGDGAVDLALASSYERLGDAPAALAAYQRWLDGREGGAMVAHVLRRVTALRTADALSPTVSTCSPLDLKNPWSDSAPPVCRDSRRQPRPRLYRDLKDPWAETI